MGAPLPRRLFTVEEYHLMAQAGVLSEDERVELVEGEVVLMTPVGSRHAACVKRLNRLFSTRAGAKAVVGVQDPVRLGAYSEPQPDVALLKPRADFYASAHRIARIAQTVSGWCARSMNIETLAELEARGGGDCSPRAISGPRQRPSGRPWRWRSDGARGTAPGPGGDTGRDHFRGEAGRGSGESGFRGVLRGAPDRAGRGDRQAVVAG